MTDRVVALVALLFLSPVLLVAVIAIRLESRGSVLFLQKRLGQHCRLFNIIKLRTMTIDNARVESQTYGDSSGVTRVGSVLRRWKIDELPQLVNVLLGEMSLVGPRPCLPKLLDEIDDVSRERFIVKPGLTGLAQVSGNVALPWPKRWQYDVKYVRSRSFIFDCRILLSTVLIIFLGEDHFKRGKNQ